jgi:hypothetical protein
VLSERISELLMWYAMQSGPSLVKERTIFAFPSYLLSCFTKHVLFSRKEACGDEFLVPVPEYGLYQALHRYTVEPVSGSSCNSSDTTFAPVAGGAPELLQ